MIEERPKVLRDIFHIKKDSLHLLLHPYKPRWLIVNDLGWEIVKLCKGGLTVNEIVSRIAQAYKKEPAVIYKDVESYLNQLSLAQFLSNGRVEPQIRKPKTSLKRLHLNITENCNIRCIHCGVVDDTTKNGGLKKEKIFEIIDELSEDDGSALAISGGEPLLHKDCLEIIKYASGKIKTSLSTNATLIDEKIAQTFSFLNIDLQISLDGYDDATHDRVRGKGTFNRALNGLRLFQKHKAGGRITLFTTVMKHNISHISEIIGFAEEMGIPSIRFLPVQRLGRALLAWETISPTPRQYSRLYTYLYRELQSSPINISGGFQGFLFEIPDGDRWCHLGETLAIDARGDIYPCSLMVHPDFLIGNIHNISLKEAIESEKLRNIIKICSSREKVIEKCKDCHWKNFCQASCPGSVFFQKGTVGDTDDLCSLRQRLYPEVIFGMAEKRMGASVLRGYTECAV